MLVILARTRLGTGPSCLVLIGDTGAAQPCGGGGYKAPFSFHEVQQIPVPTVLARRISQTQANCYQNIMEIMM